MSPSSAALASNWPTKLVAGCRRTHRASGTTLLSASPSVSELDMADAGVRPLRLDAAALGARPVCVNDAAVAAVGCPRCELRGMAVSAVMAQPLTVVRIEATHTLGAKLESCVRQGENLSPGPS
jgi:hypothetical protein